MQKKNKQTKNCNILVFQYKEDMIQPVLSISARFRFQGA